MKFFLRVIDWSGLNAHALRLRAWGAWHFCAVGTKMPNVLFIAIAYPGRCPGLWATFGLSARHK